MTSQYKIVNNFIILFVGNGTSKIYFILKISYINDSYNILLNEVRIKKA